MASQIIDSGGAVWTIAPSLAILRNGSQAAGGWGTKILWKSGAISVLGTDNNWYQWLGSGWGYTGAAAASAPVTSADGTTVPTTATQIVDSGGAVWTIASSLAILRNGSQAGGGWGTKILWKNNSIYVLGTDNNWYQWLGSGWGSIGPVSPGGPTVSADGTTVPTTASQIVDSSGAVWTIGGNRAILRDGSQVGGGWGLQILWKGGVIYVLGTDSNWWRWSGFDWGYIGTTKP